MSSDIFTNNWNKMSTEERKEALTQYLGGISGHVVCLDDERDLLEIICDKLDSFGFTPFASTEPQTALDFLQKNRSSVVLIISDFKMPQMDGFAFRQKVQAIAPEVPFIILSGYVDRETALKGLELKIAAFLEKPINEEALQNLLLKETTHRLSSIREERELLKGFTDDAANLIEQVEELILELEENPGDHDSVSKIFGMIHTIKGSSGFFEPRTLHTFAHRFEDTLKEVQSGSRPLNPTLISMWLKSCDILKTLIEEFKTGSHNEYDIEKLCGIFKFQATPAEDSPDVVKKSQTPNAQAGQPAPDKQKGPQELKVSVSLLDEFMQISGEMTVIRNMINKTVRSIEKQYPSDREVMLLGELLSELHKINSSVQAKITEIRKVPIKSVLKPLNRIIRDTAQALRKDVEFKTAGEEIRIDTSVAEVLSNSLIHLVRNSLDHGIEFPEARKNSGKPNRGEVKISSRQNGEVIFVDIEDDGRGINPENIRNKLVSNGSHTREQVQKMAPHELFQMIFSPGFSTAQQITDISGRGVGMSMVKDVVETIGGKILIESEIGKGTKFTLSIPVPKSVLITNCLFVTMNHMQFGIPQDQISRVINTSEAKQRGLIHEIEGATIVRMESELLPVLYLGDVLKLAPPSAQVSFESGYFVVLSANNRPFCLWVDSVLDVEDTVVKSITAGQIKNLGLYMGATFLGDGSIGLILNVEGIAHKSNILSLESRPRQVETNSAEKDTTSPSLDLVVCALGQHSLCAVPQERIYRLEEFESKTLQHNGTFVVAPYRDRIITFIDLHNLLNDPKGFNPDVQKPNLATLVIQYKSGYLGLVVDKVIDLVSTRSQPEPGIKRLPGSKGWIALEERSMLLVDIEELIELIANTPSEEPSALAA